MPDGAPDVFVLLTKISGVCGLTYVSEPKNECASLVRGGDRVGRSIHERLGVKGDYEID